MAGRITVGVSPHDRETVQRRFDVFTAIHDRVGVVRCIPDNTQIAAEHRGVRRGVPLGKCRLRPRETAVEGEPVGEGKTGGPRLAGLQFGAGAIGSLGDPDLPDVVPRPTVETEYPGEGEGVL